ncbi:RxLR-like protein [Plasmopara halstedii]|uniref:RxLR-like protein n=1 Tax=Plasmopara halstedii TaxID=4781 RepID=A0A0P1A742_PLAHL|nr:RxLR-like protein [Plasmopara halstedii]CEG35996.1 RxLR-like protein [Plasmopara halstedii]|eukprot:XP_024572365.1 RxLR-like protein [Plasmopara halstedii]
MRNIVLLLSLLFHGFATLGAHSIPRQEEPESEMALVAQHNIEKNQTVVTNDDKRYMDEERIELNPNAVVQTVEKVVDKPNNVNKGVFSSLMRWLLTPYRAFLRYRNRAFANTKLAVVTRLIDEGPNGYDKALLSDYTPLTLETLISHGKSENYKFYMPTDTNVATMFYRYRDLLGVPGTTVTPASLNEIWSSTMPQIWFLDRLWMKIEVGMAKVLIKAKVDAQGMLSRNIRPIAYKKALLDLKKWDETKTYTLEEWLKPMRESIMQYECKA